MTNEEVNHLLQELQRCSNPNECVNFDLTKSLERFLNFLDKSLQEEAEKSGNEGEAENDIVSGFNSAAIFVESCVKIISQKIEHLHNLAQNTMMNMYKENKTGNTTKKTVTPVFDEEYLFIHEIKNMKNIIQDHETGEEDLIEKTIPLPAFLFYDNLKEIENCKKGQQGFNVSLHKEKEHLEIKQNQVEKEIEKIHNFATNEKSVINSIKFENIFLENDAILLLDVNDYNVFIGDNEYDVSMQNKNSSRLFEKFDFFSKHSIQYSTKFSKFIEEKNKEHYISIDKIEDLLNENICFDALLFKQNEKDYDFAMGLLKNKKGVLKKFQQKKKVLSILEENPEAHEYTKDIFMHSEINNLPNYYMLSCETIQNHQDFFRFVESNELIEIIKNRSKHKEQPNEDKNDKESENNNKKLSNDEKIFQHVKIPPLYIQKLHLNISYFYLEPLIHNVIKDMRKKKNIEMFFSLDIGDKPFMDFDEINEDDSNEPSNETNILDSKLTVENFVDVLSFQDNNFPSDIQDEKKTIEKSIIEYEETIQDRVFRWNEFLEEKLEILRKQPKFDIDNYKNKLINYTLNSGEKLQFTKLIMHKEPYEICRNFLTTLMLINTNVLEIKELKTEKKTNDISNYEINIKQENIEKYLLSTSKNFKNASFIKKSVKRKKNDELIPSKKMKKLTV